MASLNTSVSLGDHFTRFAAEQVKSGRYGSTSEVIRAGLRLLEDEEKRLEILRAALDEGLASGEPVEIDFEEWLAARRAAAE